jgi:hypothetical protein
VRAPARAILVTQEVARQVLAVGKDYWYHWRRLGLLPEPVQVGDSLRWRVADLERFAEGLPSVPYQKQPRPGKAVADVG